MEVPVFLDPISIYAVTSELPSTTSDLKRNALSVDPEFWLGLSFLLVAVSLTAVLIAALPALQELSRAARSAEKLFDTLRQEIPPTLEAIRLTGVEIAELSEDIDESIKSARSSIQQVDRGLSNVRKQTLNLQISTKSFFAGFKAAWQTWQNPRSQGTIELQSRSQPPIGEEQAELEPK